MKELADAFGEDFVKDFNQTIAKRREQRNRLDEQTKKEIANQAINEGKIQADEPQFTFVTDEGVTHTAVLMQLPDPQQKSVWSYVRQLDSGAVTCPLDYLDDWWYCLFNDEEELRKMNPGQYYIVVGNLDTYEPDDGGEPQDQLSPVRGVLTLDEASEYAEQFLNDSGLNDPEPEVEEQEVEQEPVEEDMPDFAEEEDSHVEEEPEDNDADVEEDDGDSDGEDFLGFGDEDEPEEEEEDYSYDVDTIHSVVESLAEQEEAVWDVEEGDPRLDKLANVVANRDDQFDASDDNDVETVRMEVLQYIKEHNENDEDEDEDDEEESLFG